jgi:Predicted DNA alkylation repair enzyme
MHKEKGKIMEEKNVVQYVQGKLFELQDLAYKDFNSKLIPTVAPESVIGVRMPVLRKFGKEFAKTEGAKEFLRNLPHKYHEENNLHGILIAGMKEYELCIEELDRFLPFVDNWATCDMMSPKVFKKHLPELLQKIKEWIASDNTYVIRFGIGMLMSFYLDEAFELVYPQMVSEVRSEEYYVNMMIAWYFATALSKQYELVLPFIEKKCLEKWTHNKTIQKAVESYRITKEQKGYLKTLKIK